MANIFDAIKYMTDDELRTQIALFDCVNLTNAAIETGHKLMSGLADVANAFSETFARKSIFDYEYKKISDMVNDAYVNLKINTREELEKILRDRIYKLIENSSGYKAAEITGQDDEVITRILTDIASEGLAINKNLTPAHKIEEIRIKYNNALLSKIQSQLLAVTKDEMKAYASLIDKRIKEVSMQVKRQIQELLMPAQFNGIGIIKALRSQKSLTKLDAVYGLLGADAFRSDEAEVAAIFQALRNLNRISTLQIARFIWKASTSYGKKFYVQMDLLPSYISAEKKEETEEAEKNYWEKIALCKQAENNFSKCEKEIEQKNRQLEEAREKYEKSFAQYDELGKEFTKLESEKEDYINNNRGSEETKNYYSSVNDTKRKLDNSEQEYEKRKKKLHSLTQEKEGLCDRLYELETIKERTKKEAEDMITSRSNAIKIKWIAFFFRFRFDDEFFLQLVKEFRIEELVYIEQTLKEANDSKNILAVTKQPDVIISYTGGKKPARIMLEERLITGITR